ncbi:MAG: ribulose-phosphate 3-epimerase [Actinobacteria bacterium]|nr:ribulose-phosphate 3-epimerase [Actinomycetota bacterium]
MPIAAPMYKETHLLPSILSADFSELAEQVALVMDAGVRIIHVDIMDGHFVPNLTIGPAVLRSIAPLVHGRNGVFSVHLMIENPEKYVAAFVEAGADAVSFHVEACNHLYHTISEIKALGAGAGVALNPGTPISTVVEVRDLVDFLLVMTVNPGFGGQKMIEPALDKVGELRRLTPERVAIEVDGGVHEENIRRVVDLGGNWVVAGSAVFGAPDPGAEARRLMKLMHP